MDMGDSIFSTYDPVMVSRWLEWVMPFYKELPEAEELLPLLNAFKAGWEARDGE